MPGPPSAPADPRLAAVFALNDVVKEAVGTLIHGPIGGWVGAISEQVTSRVAGSLLATTLRLQVETAARLGVAVDEAEAKLRPVMAQMAALALSEYFGVAVDAAAISAGKGPAGHRGLAGNLGASILDAIFGALESQSSITPAQGRANASRLLGWSMERVLEGWFARVLEKSVLRHFAPNFHQLHELTHEALGMQRMVRLALGPLFQTLITEPFQLQLNSTYQPTRLSPGQLVKAFHSGRIAETPFFDGMAEHGYDRERAGILRVHESKELTTAEIGELLDTGAIKLDVAVQMVRDLGYSQDTALRLVQTLRTSRLRSLRGSLATLGREMYAARELDDAGLRTLAGEAGYTDDETEILLGISLLERSRPRAVPRETMERAYIEGVVELPVLQAWYESQRYAEDSIEVMLGLVAKEATAKRAKAEAEALRALPLAAAEEAYARGIIEEPRLVELYKGRGLKDDQVAILVSLAKAARVDFLDRQKRHLEPKPLPRVPRAAAEMSFILGLITDAQLLTFYASTGLPAGDQVLMLELARARKAERDKRKSAQSAAALGAAPALQALAGPAEQVGAPPLAPLG